jgi:two-component system chemotaxis sensor kinase CheA
VVEVDNRRSALLVDSLIGQQQLVVKSLENNLHAVRGVAGATILGDGRVSLILDVGALARASTPRPVRAAA